MKRSFFSLVVLVLFSVTLQAQITAPTADASDLTQYPTTPDNDDIFLFCGSDSLEQSGSLTVATALQGSKTFLWEIYNEASATFEFYSQETSDALTSQIDNLADGCYRASVTLGATTEIDRAWVFNNWTVAYGEVTQSNCEFFTMRGEFKTAVLTYYDVTDNTPVQIDKQNQMVWLLDDVWVGSGDNAQIDNPPAEDTDYTLRVFDKYDCEGIYDVLYESIVTEASFTADPMNGEAPLTVTFNNTSKNGTTGYYEWHFFRDLGEIKEEGDQTGGPVDSIDFVAFDDAPVYTYEYSGTYMVKLVSKHLSDTLTCVDTAYLENYIEVDTSFVIVPNVFTPNGDGVNDEFIIKFWSMKSLEINIFNRWGKRVHYWKSGNVEGFEGTWTETVWDGKIGNRYASPGVYYYDVVGTGRDDKKRTEHGFLHLFRQK